MPSANWLMACQRFSGADFCNWNELVPEPKPHHLTSSLPSPNSKGRKNVPLLIPEEGG